MILAFGAHTWLDNSYSSAPYPFFLSPPLASPPSFLTALYASIPS